MKRRDFFNRSILGSLGLGILSTGVSYGNTLPGSFKRSAKNFIFLVSDGMSTGTLNMADLLLREKEGRKSRWVSYYQGGFAKRALMDTASSYDGIYGSTKVPNHLFAQIQSNHTGISWAGTGHSSDYVELVLYGPGSENLPAYIENYKLHNFMLNAAQLPAMAYSG
ncbi:hypothetical protein [Cyclobacterium jeungdonense]|uniref:Alkaline phosphatase n=1 Tax=Cyclobacterium jeungdonense TaxID=708087 RepID=A0ABT8C897_9BACT|nr:hypothetical protein [Cyclobacterium jeungdonense]MDN3687853.1 hypothetical protein [Cyclobacterium jeungdonense]